MANFDNLALYTDLYQLTMAQGYYLAGKSEQRATFDYFFRTMPFDDAGYVVFAGLGDLLDALAELRFDDPEIEWLRDEGFEEEFLEFLRDFRFTAEVSAAREGELIFALEPVLRVDGSILEAQLVESLLLNMLNFQSLVATKAARLRHAADGGLLMEFGLRRAQGFGSLQATRAAYIGGAEATSNVFAARALGVPAAGTQSHAWIQSFGDELEAFRTFARQYPDDCTLLVDTYNTLHSGMPHAITVAHEMAERGAQLRAVRLDSGDLAYLSKKARAMLDEAGLHEVQIAASNRLDEHLIKSLLDQGAPIDIFGVGTRLVTGHDDAALDGVYKLAALDDEPCIKVSNNFTKVNLPAAKQITRFTYPDDGRLYADAIHLSDEPAPSRIYHPYFPEQNTSVEDFDAEPLLTPVMRDGEVLVDDDLDRAADYARHQLDRLAPEYLRFDNPHIYKVGLSERLGTLRRELYAELRDTWSD